MSFWSSVADLTGSLTSSILNRNSVKDTNKQNRQLYYEDREYNSPINQMKRLQEAGLNPNLVYGSGSVAGNVSGGAPHMQAPQLGDLGIDSAYDNYMNNKQREADIGLVQEQKRTQKSNQKYQDALTKKVEAEAKKIEETKDIAKSNEYKRGELIDQQIQNAKYGSPLNPRTYINFAKDAFHSGKYIYDVAKWKLFKK